MKKKFTGIIVSARPQGKGKLVTLLTAEEGLVNILVQDTPKVQFAYAKELLTFGYFLARVSGDFFYSLERCEIVDAFAKIKADKQKYFEAMNLCGVVKEIAQFNDQDSGLFLEFMDAFKVLNYQNLPQNLVFAKFLSSIFVGFAQHMDFKTCSICNSSLDDILFLDLKTCHFVCKSCHEKEVVVFSKKLFSELKALLAVSYAELSSISFTQIEKLSNILLDIYKYKVGERFKFYSEQ